MSARRPMIGRLLAFVVFMDGPPGSSAAFSADEKTIVLRESYHAAGLLRRLGRTWGRSLTPPVASPCGFTVLNRSVTLTLPPKTVADQPATFVQRDELWMTEAYAALGYKDGSLPGRSARLRKDLMAATYFGLGPADAFPVFATKYAGHHTAFAAGGTVVLHVPELQTEENLAFLWGLLGTNLDGTIAHEIGHVFDHGDEYGRCSQNDKQGFFDTPNANCVVGPSTAHQSCLMDHNVHVVCPTTIETWGWVDRDHDGVADLGAPATIELPFRDATVGQKFRIKGRNVWDARVVFFGDKPVDRVSVMAVDEIEVEVPSGVTGIVTVSLLTRAGLATGPFDDTWVLVVGADLPSHPAGTAVFGVIPRSAAPGTTVTILGNALASPTAVMFGDSPADLSSLGPNLPSSQLSVTVPPSPAGEQTEKEITVTVRVTTSIGTSPPFPPFSDFTYP